MNFLGHAYLSFDHAEVLVGNMISDCVKGRAQYDYPEAIQKGIRLHRSIDDFTDAHPAIKEAQQIFRPHYRLYSAPLVDVVFDYFLANDPNCFAPDALFSFTQHTYNTIDQYSHLLPQNFASLFTYMKRDNWLYNYRTAEGIGKSIRGLMYRASMPDDGTLACNLLREQQLALRQCFERFIPDVKKFAKARLSELLP